MPKIVQLAWQSGERLGRYEIRRRLARGGMADVWHARLVGICGFRRDVALKTMRAEMARSPALVRMFINEAAIGARLHHPSIVQTFDFGRTRGTYFIAMEYIPGLSLRQLGLVLARRGRRLPREILLRVAVDIARGLAYAQAAGVLGFVHRDVSPENMMVSYAGASKLIDFGVAKLDGGAGGVRAASDLFPVSAGKLPYVSPERLRGAAGDARTDVYALGVILYEYLCGRHPYDGRAAGGRAPGGGPRDLCALVPDLPASVGLVVERAMAADPNVRHADAGQLAEDLTQLLARPLGRDPLAVDATEVDEILGVTDPIRAGHPARQPAVRRRPLVALPPVGARPEAASGEIIAKARASAPPARARERAGPAPREGRRGRDRRVTVPLPSIVR